MAVAVAVAAATVATHMGTVGRGVMGSLEVLAAERIRAIPRADDRPRERLRRELPL